MVIVELKQPIWQKILAEYYTNRVPLMGNEFGYDYSIWDMLEKEYGGYRTHLGMNTLQDYLRFDNHEDAVAFKLKWG